jgi:hypothetical protein
MPHSSGDAARHSKGRYIDAYMHRLSSFHHRVNISVGSISLSNSVDGKLDPGGRVGNPIEEHQ